MDIFMATVCCRPYSSPNHLRVQHLWRDDIFYLLKIYLFFYISNVAQQLLKRLCNVAHFFGRSVWLLKSSQLWNNSFFTADLLIKTTSGKAEFFRPGFATRIFPGGWNNVAPIEPVFQPVASEHRHCRRRQNLQVFFATPAKWILFQSKYPPGRGLRH